MTGHDAIDSSMKPPKPVLRGDTYHLVRRVPKRYQNVEPLKLIYQTLKTDSEAEARQKAAATWDQLVAGWEARLAGDTTDAEKRFDAAREIAQRRGFRFLPYEKVLGLPIEEIVARVDAIRDGRDGFMDPLETDALLGMAEMPSVTWTRALDVYVDISADKTRKKSPDQLRRWRNPLKKAVRNFTALKGDLALQDTTVDDAYDFREWWLDRVEELNLTPASANKDFIHLSTIFKKLNQRKRMGLANPFAGISLQEEEKRHRLPFSEAFLRDVFLAPGALGALNTEARCIVLGMVNTGYRPSEGAALTRAQIRLDCDVPHLLIDPPGRELKTQYSKRIIPLAGVSLEAFRAHPDGFPRYADSSGLSSLVNKFLRNNDMAETPGHTLYGLRHSFEDRLLDRDVDERIRRDLMGHTLNRQRYGKGASLEKLAEIIHSIAL